MIYFEASWQYHILIDYDIAYIWNISHQFAGLPVPYCKPQRISIMYIVDVVNV